MILNSRLARALLPALVSLCTISTVVAPVAAVAQPSGPPVDAGSASERTELVAERTAYGKVFLNDDGSRTAVLGTEPIHYRDTGGAWKEIDNELVGAPQGNGYVNRAGGNTFSFAPHGGVPALVRAGRGRDHFSFGIDGGSRTEPVVDGNEITYEEILPGVDLEFSVLGESLKELVVLNAPPQVQGPLVEMRFPIRFAGMTARQDGERIVFEDADGNPAFVVPKPFMFDSAVEETSGESAFSEDVHLELASQGGTQFLRLTADAAWLAAPERVYPIYIDPYFGPNTPSVDTFVQSNIFNTPQDQFSDLKSGYYSGPESPEPITARSLLRFNLDIIPKDATIDSAKLRLWENWSYSCDPRIVEVYRITEEWNSQVTWSNKPNFAADHADAINAAKGYYGCESGWLGFDVRSIVSYWKNSAATNEGFGIKARNESDTYGWKRFASDQGGNKPQLEVQYQPAASNPTPTNSAPRVPTPVAPTEGTVLTTGYPTFKAVYRDPDDGPGRVDFRIYRSTDPCCTGIPFRGSSGTTVFRGDVSSWELTNPLPDGSYRWVGVSNDGSLTSAPTDPINFTVESVRRPTITSAPPDPSNDATPTWTFTGQSGQSFVECRLTRASDNWLIRRDAFCQSPWTHSLENYADARYTFSVQAQNPDGQVSLPATSSYTLDRVGPTTTPSNVTTSPASPSNNTKPVWSWSGDLNEQFDCHLSIAGSVHDKTSNCRPGQYSPQLGSDGTYNLWVTARDAAGNSAAGGAAGSYILDTTPPSTPTVTSSPASPSRSRTPSWSFAGGAGPFECRLMQGSTQILSSGCTSPKSFDLTGRPDGGYTFQVREVDSVGNRSAYASSPVYTLDTQASPPTVSAPSPGSPANTRTPSWTFSGETGATFECQLRLGTQVVQTRASCTSPKTYTISGADGKYQIEVWQTDRAGNVSSPAGSFYELDTTAPGAPVITKSPPATANDDTPTWEFQGEMQTTFECRLSSGGEDVFPWAGCTSPRTYTLQSDGSYVLEIRQSDLVGNKSTVTSSQAYVLDRIAPDAPTILSGPADPSSTASPEWTFTGENGASFECRLERGATVVAAPAPCGSPRSYSLADQPDGTYTFGVRQSDAAGNISGWATRSHAVDRVAPDAPVVTAPASPSSDRNPTWTFTGESGATFECRVREPGATAPDFLQCMSPTSYDLTGKPDGVYVLDVRQTDRAGNLSAVGSASYELDSQAPDAPEITTKPQEFSNDETPTWGFTGEPLARFACALHREAEEISPNGTCTSPKSYDLSAQPDGPYTFSVVQVDRADNVSAPAEHTYVLDRTEPGSPTGVTSTSHVPHVAFKDTTVDMSWQAPVPPDPSGIKGYSWVFRREVACAPGNVTAGCHQGDPSPSDGTITDEDPEATSVELDAGRYWFHVRAVDAAGNAGEEVVYGPLVIDPQGSPIPLTPTLDEQLVAQSDTNGMEQFYAYTSSKLGPSTAYAQLHTGNLVVQTPDVRVPGQGLNMTLSHTYNLDRHDRDYHDNGVGRGWVLSLAENDFGLMGSIGGAAGGLDLNTPLAISDAVVDPALEATGKIVELTDGDGTVHRFVRRGGPTSEWESPPGVDLRLQEVRDSTGLTVEAYRFVRPDGIVYEATQPTVVGETVPADTWHVTSIRERDGFGSGDGNWLKFEYRRLDLGNNLTNPLGAIRLGWVTHRRYSYPVACVRYDQYGNLDKVVSLPERGPTPTPLEDPDSDCVQGPNGRSRVTEYTVNDETQHLVSVTHNAQTTTALGKRTIVYRYQDTALPSVLPSTPVERQQDMLVAVIDPRDSTTTFRYDDSTGKVRLMEIVDRENERWTYRYDPADPNTGERETVVTPPGPAAAKHYLLSARRPISEQDTRYAGGNILRITDGGADDGPIVKRFEWTKNLLTKKVDGAGAETTMVYNDLGLLTRVVSPSPNDPSRTDLPSGAHSGTVTTLLDYDTPSFGIADLVQTTVAAETSKQRITEYDVDPATGEMLEVVRRANPDGTPDPQRDRVTTFTYHVHGAIKTVDGPRKDVTDVTTYGDYYPNDLPGTITDAAGNTATFEYTPYGMTTKEVDRAGNVTTSTYDARDNMLTRVDAELNETSYTYDGNDNRLTETTPLGTKTASVEDDHQTRQSYDLMDRLTTTSKPGKTEADPRRTWTISYFGDGSKEFEENPAGARTSYAYWPNEALKVETKPAATGDNAVFNYFYDAAGRVDRILRPEVDNAGTRPVQEAVYSPAGTIVTRRETSASGAIDRITRLAYNVHSEEIESVGPRSVGDVTEAERREYNPFGENTLVSRRLNAGRWLDNTIEYDLAGNKISSTQPAGDPSMAAADRILTTTYEYDKLNQLVEESDPVNPGHTIEYTYLPEGQQETKTDLHDGTPQRVVRNTYNADYTDRSVVSTDMTTSPNRTLATCNWAQGQAASSGYDADDNLLDTRTIKGTQGCDGGHTVRTQTFGYDHRNFIESTTQSLDPWSGDGHDAVSRTQVFTYRNDGVVRTSTWAGKESTFRYSPAGWVEGATDWRNAAVESTLTLQPTGSYASVVLGGDARADYDYHADGSMSELVWEKTGGALIRSHTAISYDVGGQRTGETLDMTRPEGEATTTDTGGRATFGYDLVGRLASWTSPFRFAPGEPRPSTEYTIDDGGNITLEEKRVDGTLEKKTTRVYEHGRLDHVVTDPRGSATTSRECFTYTVIGEEKTRRITTGGCSDTALSTTTNDYDPAGHTDEVETSTPDASATEIDYVYDQDIVIGRKKGSETRLFFYWGDGSSLTEETDASGDSKVTYFRTPEGNALAQQRNGVWTWLLEDPHGSAAAHLKKENGTATITSQQSFDPYGAPNEERQKESSNSSKSTLGFQGAHTDEDTDRLLLGSRQYDPQTQRFTTPDYFVQGPANLSLGTDPLTGNRYVFAAANPVAFYDDGHAPSDSGGGGPCRSCGGSGGSGGGSGGWEDGWWGDRVRDSVASGAGWGAKMYAKHRAGKSLVRVPYQIPYGTGKSTSGLTLQRPTLRSNLPFAGGAAIGGAVTQGVYDLLGGEDYSLLERGLRIGGAAAIQGGFAFAAAAACGTGVGCLVVGGVVASAAAGWVTEQALEYSDEAAEAIEDGAEQVGDWVSDLF